MRSGPPLKLTGLGSDSRTSSFWMLAALDAGHVAAVVDVGQDQLAGGVAGRTRVAGTFSRGRGTMGRGSCRRSSPVWR